MTENPYMLKPGEQFPEEMEAPEREDILIELSKFNIGDVNTIKLIDTTRDALDVRLNYIIDKKWVLRFCNAPDMTEKRMGELNRLIGRYQAMGIKCPAFIADDNGKYLHPWKQFLCYLSEYIDLPLASDIELNDEEELDFQVAESVAKFAETYRNVDLSETMGMYSLFDLSPFDIPNGIDEKQDNFNQLINLFGARVKMIWQIGWISVIQIFAKNSKQFSMNYLVVCFKGTRILRMCWLMMNSISSDLSISI